MRVVIIGSGIVGMSLAYHLAQRNVEVVAIDQTRPGGVASAASFACINYFNYWQPPYYQLRRDAIEHVRGLSADIQAEPFLHLEGTLRWAEEPAGWKPIDRSVAELEQLGVKVEYWAPQEVTRHLEPDLDLTGITRDIIRIPGEGWMDGVPFVGRLMAAARSSGRFEWIHERAIACEANNQGITVRAEHGSIIGDVLVLAAGIGTGELAKTLGTSVPVREDPGVLLVSNYLTSDVRHVLYPGSIHVRPDGGGRIMAGRHGGDLPPNCSSATEALLIAQKVARRVPGFSLSSEHSVLIGVRPVPQDSLPVVGWLPGHTRAYVAVCHSGMTLGPFLGALGANEILGRLEKRLAPYRPERFASASSVEAAVATH